MGGLWSGSVLLGCDAASSVGWVVWWMDDLGTLRVRYVVSWVGRCWRDMFVDGRETVLVIDGWVVELGYSLLAWRLCRSLCWRVFSWERGQSAGWVEELPVDGELVVAGWVGKAGY